MSGERFSATGPLVSPKSLVRALWAILCAMTHLLSCEMSRCSLRISFSKTNQFSLLFYYFCSHEKCVAPRVHEYVVPSFEIMCLLYVKKNAKMKDWVGLCWRVRGISNRTTNMYK